MDADVSGDKDRWLKLMLPVDLLECLLLCGRGVLGGISDSAMKMMVLDETGMGYGLLYSCG